MQFARENPTATGAYVGFQLSQLILHLGLLLVALGAIIFGIDRIPTDYRQWAVYVILAVVIFALFRVLKRATLLWMFYGSVIIEPNKDKLRIFDGVNQVATVTPQHPKPPPTSLPASPPTPPSS